MLTAEQLEQRKSGIGGSDCGSILGLNKYASPLDVYLDKIGESEPKDLSDNEAVHFGNVLEDVVAREYMRRFDVKVQRRNKQIKHPEFPFMLANLDRVVVGEKKVLEIKTAGQYMADDWGEEDTDEVPHSYLAQVMHYLIVTGFKVADVAVLIGGRNFRRYTIPYDITLADMIIEKEAEFWQRVLDRDPPEPTTVEDLSTLYAYDNGKAVLATDIQIAKWQRLKDLKGNVKTLDTDIEALEFDLKKALGPNMELLLGDDGRPIITWKKAKDSMRFNEAALKKDNPAVHKAYLKETTGSRRFLVKK